MITKYSRKQINLKATLHNKEFALVDEVEQLIMQVLNDAVTAGAEPDKLMEIIDNE